MITRRDFIKISGLAIGLIIAPSGFQILKAEEIMNNNLKPVLWLQITKNNELIILSNKSEMGQGVYTGLAMLVADELDFPWEKVKVKAAPASDIYKDEKFGSQLTGGSTSLRHMHEFYRYLGATAKEMILNAASEKLNISKSNLKVKEGYLWYKDKRYPYSHFWDYALKLPIPQEVNLKNPEEFIYIGKNVPRIDVPEKVNGRAIFGIDVKLKNMVYAVVERPNYFDSKVEDFNKDDILKEKGILDAFPIQTGVAIVGETFESLLKVRNKVKVKWSRSSIEGYDDNKLQEYYLNKLNENGNIARNDGNVIKVIQNVNKKIEETYLLPYLYHGTIEPMNCVANITDDRCEIYAPIQAQTFAQKVAMEVTGFDKNKVDVYTTYLGGGFGRKSNVLFVKEAVEISKKLKRPVKLIYTREDDVKSQWYRPMNATILKAGLDNNGNLIALYHKIAVPAVFEWAGRPSKIDRAAVEGIENMFYDIPNVHVEFVKVDLPIPVWFWRSVGSSHNAFTLETFIDRVAKLSHKDPVELRLKLLSKNQRAQNVIQTVAEKAGWGKTPKYGAAMGIAYHYSFGTHVAQVAEVSLDKSTGIVKVHRVVCAIDLGPTVINPDLVIAQVESAVNMGLSAALKEAVHFGKSGPSNLNFDTYPILTMDEAPDEIEVHIVKGEGSMGGVGEPGLPPIAPAVANALFWGYDIKVNRLPMTPDYIKSLIL
ncbi:MAG: molybdopterin cofactor-binding domain-containing protein [Sulfurihydrogenibium azorense]